ncbi:M14 family metallopeptidase [Robiginitalea sediminis]|uniref:M14 family metallopeptidase n=1 Tax=Robiginitalea sediminis TaxID=1982593 RepID=UPI000B4AE807|nr:M14 metallopeptidase family protein [Robiginitalea sediminis]
MIRKCLLLAVCGISLSATAQTEAFTQRFFETYEKYREPSIGQRRIQHQDIQPLIDRFARTEGFEVRKVGSSIEGRDLRLLSTGRGETDIFLWSQMHGDEPTATQAIFDILNFLSSEDFREEKQALLDSVRIHFLPMLNPDGAARFQRHNFLGIDINRDALRLQSPEGQTLKRVRDSLQAEFGFNLHDQSRYYNAEQTPKPATISYLAPAYNYEKEVNVVRARAMRVIGYMNRILQEYAPGQVGRYNDDFEPRAFGDNIQKWGTSAILIESGGYPEDLEKQEIRKLNYVSILSAIYAIASGSYTGVSLDDYYQIPENDRKMLDLKIQEVTYPLEGKSYLMDFGIYRAEVDRDGHRDFWNIGRITDMGDLSTFYGYETVQATGLELRSGKLYPTVLPDMDAVSSLDFRSLLQEGYTYVRVQNVPEKQMDVPFPVHIVGAGFKNPPSKWDIGDNATFVLYKENKPLYAIVNGFLYDLEQEWETGNNSLILRKSGS